MADAQGQTLQFLLEEVEVELLLDVKKAGSGDAAIKFGVVAVGAKGGIDQTTSHRVKLRLTPIDHSGRSPTISDEE